MTYFRLAASPGAAHEFFRIWMETDIRDVLPAIRVPTLVLFRRPNHEAGRYLATQYQVRLPSSYRRRSLDRRGGP